MEMLLNGTFNAAIAVRTTKNHCKVGKITAYNSFSHCLAFTIVSHINSLQNSKIYSYILSQACIIPSQGEE